MARTTPATVRQAMNATVEEYPDGRLTFAIESAESIVNSQLAPYTTNQGALRMTETYVAAAIATGASGGDRELETVEADGARMRFASGGSGDAESPAEDYWQLAREHDPTGRLGRKKAQFRVT